MKHVTNVLLYITTIISIVNLILAMTPHTQIAWLSSSIGWGMAAFQYYRAEIAE